MPGRVSEPPLSRIALSLSGGGYGAAAFHLGTLDLLERVGLLRIVEAPSVSKESASSSRSGTAP